MKQELKKSKFTIGLFMFMTGLIFLFVFMYASKFFIPADEGLAAGAMVFYYGIAGFVIGLVCAFFIQRKLNQKQLIYTNSFLSLILIGILLLITQVMNQ